MLVQAFGIILILGLASFLGGAWSAYWGRSDDATDQALAVLKDMRTGGQWGMRAGTLLTAIGAAGLVIFWVAGWA